MKWSGNFDWDGVTGVVTVECVPDDDVGFPICTAWVRYPRRGYDSMFGWVQLVRSTDNASHGEEFEADPFALVADAGSPYGWYGTEPTLFDAPKRRDRTPLAWLAYSFLATTPLDEVSAGLPRRVVPLLGIAWGFDIHDDGAVTLRELEALEDGEWETVVPVLRAAYPAPGWTFAS